MGNQNKRKGDVNPARVTVYREEKKHSGKLE